MFIGDGLKERKVVFILEQNEVWKPFPKQERALTLSPEEVFEILFGG